MNRHVTKTAIITLLLSTLGIGAETTGPEGASSQPTTQSEQAADLVISELKPETVEARIRQVESSINIDPAIKTELLGLLGQTLGQLKLANAWIQETQRFEQQRQQLPAELAQLRSRLEQATTAPATQLTVDIPANATLAFITQSLQDAETEARSRREAFQKSEENIQIWSDRRSKLPQKLAQARAQLEEVNRNINTPPSVGIAPEVVSARREALLANRRALENEIKAYEQESRVYDTVGADVLNARREVARIEATKAQALVEIWQKHAAEKRLAEIEKQRQEAERQLAQAPTALRDLAEANKQLAKERGELNIKISESVASEKKLNETAQQLDKELRLLRDKIQSAGMAAYVGPLLSKQRAQLPNIAGYRRDIRAINSQINQVQFRQIELGQQRSLYDNLEQRVQAQLMDLQRTNPDLDRVRIEPEVRNLLRGHQEVLDALLKDYDTYWKNLIDLNGAASNLVAKTQEFEDFINERVLWLPSNDLLFNAKWPDRLIPPSGVIPAIFDALLLDLIHNATPYAVVVLLALLWLVAVRKIRERRKNIDQRVRHIYTDSFALTWQEILIDLYYALPIPMFLWFLGRRMYWSVPADSKDVYDFAYALSQALRSIPLFLFIMLFLLNIFRKDGVAETHFHWNPRRISLIRNNLRWLTVASAPLAFAAFFANYQPDENWRGTVGRLIFACLMGLLTVFAHRLLHPRLGVLAPPEQDDNAKRIPPQRWFWYLLATSIPLVLLIASVVGYHYTATELIRRISRTMWLIVVLLVIRATIVRAIVVAHHKLAIRIAKEERAASTPPAESTGQAPPSSPSDQQTTEELSERTKTLLRWLVAFGLLPGIWGIWQDIVPAFGFVNRIEIWSYTAEVPREIHPGDETAAETRTVKTTVSVKLSHLLLAMIVAAATVVLVPFSVGQFCGQAA